MSRAAVASTGESWAPMLLGRAATAMGSPLRLTIACAGADSADSLARAWTAVREEFEAAEQAMSRYRESSEVTRLCRSVDSASRPRSVSRRLRVALSTSDRAVRATGGRFDPRIVDDLERLGFGAVPQRPADQGIRPARPAALEGSPDHLYDLMQRRSVRLHAPVDLGGIGKGLALRWSAAALAPILAGRGVRGYLIDAGGDIVVEGSPGHEPWSVGIEDPHGGPTPIAVVAIRGPRAITTSSTRIHRREQDGRVVHHLVDPRTHEPADARLLAVTVSGRDPAWSEVWSKALFVEGRRGIAALARRHGLAAWWVGEDGLLEMTAAARAMTTWVAREN